MTTSDLFSAGYIDRGREVFRSPAGRNLTFTLRWKPKVATRRAGWWKIQFENADVAKIAIMPGGIPTSGYTRSVNAARREARRQVRRLTRGIDRAVDDA